MSRERKRKTQSRIYTFYIARGPFLVESTHGRVIHSSFGGVRTVAADWGSTQFTINVHLRFCYKKNAMQTSYKTKRCRRVKSLEDEFYLYAWSRGGIHHPLIVSTSYIVMAMQDMLLRRLCCRAHQYRQEKILCGLSGYYGFIFSVYQATHCRDFCVGARYLVFIGGWGSPSGSLGLRKKDVTLECEGDLEVVFARSQVGGGG